MPRRIPQPYAFTFKPCLTGASIVPNEPVNNNSSKISTGWPPMITALACSFLHSTSQDLKDRGACSERSRHWLGTPPLRYYAQLELEQKTIQYQASRTP